MFICLFSVYFIEPTIESMGVEGKSFLSCNIRHQNDKTNYGINQEEAKYGVQKMGFNRGRPKNFLGGSEIRSPATAESMWSRQEQNTGLKE